MNSRPRTFILYDETPETAEEALGLFLAQRKASGAAPRTLQGYEEIIRSFFKKYPDAWSSACRTRLIDYLGQPGIAPSTHNFRLKALSPFFAFCVEKKAFDSSPAAALKGRRAEPRIVDHPPEDLLKLIDRMDCSKFNGIRDMALFLLSIDTGIRPSEALQLLPTDVNTREGKAFIRSITAKTRKSRQVFFSKKTGQAMNALAALRRPEWGTAVPLFCTRQGTEWNTHGWTVQLQRYARAAEIGRFSAYDLRHCHAITFLQNGGNVFALSREMGHTDLDTTRHYLNFSDRDLQENHAHASPVTSLVAFGKKAGVPQTA